MNISMLKNSVHSELTQDKAYKFYAQNTNLQITPELYRLTVVTTMLSFASVWTTGYLHFQLYIFILASLFLFIKGNSAFKTRWFTDLISILILVYAVNAYSTGNTGIIILTQFSVNICFIQLISAQTFREISGTLILSVMIVLAVSAMNVNFAFPITLFPYTISLALLLQRLVVNGHSKMSTQMFSLKGRPQKAALKAALRIISFIFLFMTLCFSLFYLIPRSKGLGIASEFSRRKLKGFSDSMKLGEGGLLEDNPAVVMRIKPLEEKTKSISVINRIRQKYLRGTSFSSYDNGHWLKGNPRRWNINLWRNQGELVLNRKIQKQTSIHRLEIQLENIQPPTIFFPDGTVTANFETRNIVMTKDRSFYFPNRKRISKKYQVAVNIDLPPIQDVSMDKVKKLQTQKWKPYLTTSGIKEAIKQTANQIARGNNTINTRVQAVIAFLRDNYKYSLYENPSNNSDPVEEFLYKSKAGSCEHFSSAMVLLLRTMDIPARPVTGYAIGEWNTRGGFFTVRQRDAHAWVEVFFPGSGWTPFDPSPEVAFNNERRFYFPGSQLLWEVFEGFWYNYVYNFNYKVQYNGYQKIFSSIYNNFSYFSQILKLNAFLYILIASVLLLLYKMMYLFQKRKYPKISCLPSWYQQWETNTGLARENWMTPREYHKHLLDKKVFSTSSNSLLSELADLVDLEMFDEKQTSASKQAKQVIKQINEE